MANGAAGNGNNTNVNNTSNANASNNANNNGNSINGNNSSTIITAAEISNPDVEANKQSIADKILNATGRNEQYDTYNVCGLTVYYGDVLENERAEAVISLCLGPKDTIVVVYRINDQGNYVFVSEVGRFYQILSLTFVKIEGEPKNSILINEYVNQMIGSFEETTFVHSFIWRTNYFREILRFVKDLKAYWNILWNVENAPGPHQWERVTQNTEIEMNEPNTEMNLTRNQAYGESEVNSDQVPEESTFNEVKSRTINELYMWSPKWDMYILGESQDRSTGQTVAILQDFSKSAYSLIGFETNSSLIMRQDGDIEIVKNENLSPVGIQARGRGVFN